MSFYRECTSKAPDELTAYAVLESTSTGIPAIVINLCYSRNLTEGVRQVQPLKNFGSPLVDLVHERPYSQTISRDAGAPDGRHY